MMVTSTAHIYGDTHIKASPQKDQDEGQYIALNIGDVGQLMLFINDRKKALEIASALEKAVQDWEEVAHEHGQDQAAG